MSESFRSIKCHQFLAGRFHEGYGRTELSRMEENGRRKLTFDYETRNLTGRNEFLYVGYQAYEIEPTHQQGKCPGVFCVTNATENGTQAARTYGLIPVSGNIQDALCILRNRPVMEFEQFAEYDYGREMLSWDETSWKDAPRKEYRLSEAATDRLGQFMAEYWSTMYGRESGSRDVVALHLDFHLNDDALEPATPEEQNREQFLEQVDFFANVVVPRYPEAVQSMISVCFGAPWTRRRIHPDAACIVTSEDDLKANSVYSFSITRSMGVYDVDIGKIDHVADKTDNTGEAIAKMLIGQRSIPALYQNMTDFFRNINDSEILRVYEVLDLIMGIEIQKDRWEELPADKREKEIKNTATANKKKYELLFKTLRTKCGCSEQDAFSILLPLLEQLLSMMQSIDEGTEFQNVFSAEDIRFFAGCRRCLENMDDIQTADREKLNKLLVDNYIAWSDQAFPSNIGKSTKQEDPVLPERMFYQLSSSALTENEQIGQETIKQIRDYYQEHYKLDQTDEVAKSFIELVIEKDSKLHEINEEYIQEWEKWLVECGLGKDLAGKLAILFPLYLKAFDENSTISSEYVADFYDEIQRKLSDEMDEKITTLRDNAERFLLTHFDEWSEGQFRLLRDQTISAERFCPIATKWLADITSEQTEEPEKNEQTLRVIEHIQEYLQDARDIQPMQDIPPLAKLIFQWIKDHFEVDKKQYEKQENWLNDCRVHEKKTVLKLLLQLASSLTDSEEKMDDADVEFVGEHMDAVLKYQQEWTDPETFQLTKEITRKESDYLLEHFVEWRKSVNNSSMSQRGKNEKLVSMVSEWQSQRMMDTGLSSEELTEVYNSLTSIRKEDGSKLDLEPLHLHIAYTQLREHTEACRKNPNKDTVQELAGCFQKIAGREDDQYEDYRQQAQILLSQEFLMWSEADFMAGDREPDSCLIPIAEGWLNMQGGSRGADIPSEKIREIEDKLVDKAALRSQEGKELLAGIHQRCFEQMRIESRNQGKTDQADADWWDRLAEYYESEDEDQRLAVVKILDEACGRKNQQAKRIMMEILRQRNNAVPEDVSRNSRWNDIRKERLNEAVLSMLSRFGIPEDLVERKLAVIWEEDYEEDYTTRWQELQTGGDYEGILKAYLSKLYTESGEPVAFLQKLWNSSDEEYENSNGTAKVEKAFVGDTLKSFYSDLWKNGARDERNELDAFTQKVQNNLPLGLEATDAGKARDFLEAYQSEQPLSLKDISQRIRELSQHPQWISWINWDEMETNNSCISRSVRERRNDFSTNGIGLRLIHDMVTQHESTPGAYWGKTVLDITKAGSFSELAKVQVCTAEGGRALNALSWLCNAAAEIDNAGSTTMQDLKKCLSSEAPGLISDLNNETKRTKLWANWREIFPANLVRFIEME